MQVAVADFIEHQKPKVEAVEEAIQLALAFRWAEAEAANRDLLERFGPDADALNRLGKSLMELGRLREAQEAYRKTLEISPSNQIARRQLAKLEETDLEPAVPSSGLAGLDANFFTEEPGKTVITRLVSDCEGAPGAVLPGDPAQLVIQSGGVLVKSSRGAELGTLEPRLAQRLVRLTQGGNRYAGAVTHVDQAGIQVIVREMFQAEAMAGTVSFPSRKGRESDYRPYAKEAARSRDADPVVSLDEEDDEELVSARPSRLGADVEDGFTEFSELDDPDDAAESEDDAEDDADDY
ncbi:MAG: tetratricopeptide repeat protein [Candidatus Dormibacteria bacterium]